MFMSTNSWHPKWDPKSMGSQVTAIQFLGGARSWLCIQRDVGRRPNGIVFFWEITGFQRRDIYANQSQIVNSRFVSEYHQKSCPNMLAYKDIGYQKIINWSYTLQHVDWFMLFNSHIFNSNINVKNKQSRIAGVNITPGGCDSPLE